MRRDLVTWTFALGVTLIVLLSFTPAFAYTARELLGERSISANCDKVTRICTLSQDDLEWVVDRTELLTKIAEQNARQLKNCGVKGV